MGLIELQNNGFESESAIVDLISALNDRVAEEDQYRFAQPTLEKIGTDQITNGILYRPSRLTTNGPMQLITEFPFDPDTKKNRIPVIQPFTVNHSNQL